MGRRFALSTTFSDVSQQIDVLAERDLGIEITLYDSEWLINLDKTTAVRRLGDQLAERGIEVTIHAPIFDLNPGSLDPVVRKHTRLCWERAITVAAALGARLANFHTGFMPLLPASTYPGWLALSLEIWDRVIDLAAEAGLVIVLENMFEPTPRAMLDIRDRLDDRHIGFTLDVAHMHIYGSVSHDVWWQELGPGIREVHLHDTDTFSDDHLLIGDGSIDWKRIFECLFLHAPDAVKVIEMPVEAGLQSLARIRAGGYSDIQLELL